MIHATSRYYEDFLKIVRILAKNYQDHCQAFRRMVFNVPTYNRDDHVKNTSFCLDVVGDWNLDLADDLTLAPGPGGQHSMTVQGHGKALGKRELWAMGRGEGLKNMDIDRNV